MRQSISRLDYGKLTPAELGKLWVQAVRRGDDDEAARILRVCPRTSGSLRDVVFIDVATRGVPGRVKDVIGFVQAEIPKLELVISDVPPSRWAIRLLDAFERGDKVEATRIVLEQKYADEPFGLVKRV